MHKVYLNQEIQGSLSGYRASQQKEQEQGEVVGSSAGQNYSPQHKAPALGDRAVLSHCPGYSTRLWASGFSQVQVCPNLQAQQQERPHFNASSRDPWAPSPAQQSQLAASLQAQGCCHPVGGSGFMSISWHDLKDREERWDL